jgi:hypothetical protein
MMMPKTAAANHTSPSLGLGVCKLSPFSGIVEYGGDDDGGLPIRAGVDLSCLVWALRANKATPQNIAEHVDGVGARKAEGLYCIVRWKLKNAPRPCWARFFSS